MNPGAGMSCRRTHSQRYFIIKLFLNLETDTFPPSRSYQLRWAVCVVCVCLGICPTPQHTCIGSKNHIHFHVDHIFTLWALKWIHSCRLFCILVAQKHRGGFWSLCKLSAPPVGLKVNVHWTAIRFLLSPLFASFPYSVEKNWTHTRDKREGGSTEIGFGYCLLLTSDNISHKQQKCM